MILTQYLQCADSAYTTQVVISAVMQRNIT